MKKVVLVVLCLMFATALQAQTEKTAPAKAVVTKTKQVQNPAAYACMKCFNIEKSEGKCSKCSADKVQLGTYYCDHCQKSTAAKKGKCSCGAETVMMTRKLCGSKTGKKDKPKEVAKKAA